MIELLPIGSMLKVISAPSYCGDIVGSYHDSLLTLTHLFEEFPNLDYRIIGRY